MMIASSNDNYDDYGGSCSSNSNLVLHSPSSVMSTGTNVLLSPDKFTAPLLSPKPTSKRRRHRQQQKLRRGRNGNAKDNTSSSSTRKVRFSKYDSIYDIPHVDDLSSKLIRNVWYSLDEIKQIRIKASRILRRIEEEEEAEEDMQKQGYCMRGLDQHTTEYTQKRRIINKFLTDAVIRLQPFKTKVKQHDSVEVDVDKLISELCSKYSASATEYALERAHQDEEIAMAIHHPIPNNIMLFEGER